MSRMGRRGAIATPMTGAALSVSITGTADKSGSTASTTFSMTAAVVGGVSPTYAWNLNGSGIGTWAITAGAGTATITVTVSAAPSGEVSSADIGVTVTSAGYTAEAFRHLTYTRS